MQQKWADADEETRNWYRDGIRVALDALLSPSPCPTCGGTHTVAQTPDRGADGPTECPDCTDGMVPPLLRWNEAP